MVSTGILVGTSSISCPNVGLETPKASAAIVNIKTKYQSTANLNLRQGAGATYKSLLTIPKGKVITATQKNGNWYKVTYSAKTGWVNGTYLKEYYTYTTQSTAYYLTNKTTKLYPTPDTKKAAVYTVVANNGFSSTQKVVNSIGQTWLRVSYNGKTLYVNSTDVTKSTAATFAQTEYKAIKMAGLYQSFGNSSKVLAKIPIGTIVSSSKRVGNWYYVTFNGKSGYVYISNFTKVNNTYITQSTAYYLTNKTTKLYPTPDTKKAAVYTVGANNGFSSTQKVVNSIGQTWFRVSYNGKTLYVNSTDVTKSALATFAQTKYKAIKVAGLYQSFGNSSKVLAHIPIGTVVSSSKRIGNWYNVTFNGITGYVYISNFTKANEIKYETTSTAYYFTKAVSNLYATPDATKPVVTTVSGDNGFASTQKATDLVGKIWYRINYNGQNLYVKSEDVTANSYTTFTTTNYKALNATYLYQSFDNASKQLIQIPKDTVLPISKKIGNWYNVTFNGKTGYVYMSNFTKANEIKYETTSTAYYFTKAVTNLYATPDATKPVVTTVSGDNGFASTQKATDLVGKIWYRINYNGQNLYVKSEDVTANSYTTFTTTNYKALNATYLYQSFDNASKQLIQIPKDTVLPISKKIGNWYSVKYNDVNGYVRAGDFGKSDVVTITNITDTTYITTSDLNLRQTYDAASPLLTVVPVNMVLVVTDKTSNNWYKVSYNGKTGYVSGSYIKQVKTGDPLTSRDSYQFIDLRTPSTVTATQINNYIASKVKSGVLNGQGQLFVDAGKKYGVNALYLAAHAIHESGFGTSQISLGKNNLFGFGSYDTTPYIASYKFMSVQENVEYIARSIKSTYLNPSNWKYHGAYLGFSTKDMNNVRMDAASEGMNFYYATDPNWGALIAQHMQKILPFDKAYYDKAQPNTTIPGSPSTPVGSDIFPANIQAVAKGNIDLYNAKGDTSKVKSIAASTAFLLLEKTNNYWIKLSIDGNVYWTNSIKLNAYSQTLSVKNLGRTTDVVNVRSTATTAENNIINTLNLNTYVSIVTNTDGTLTMDSTKKWYKIQLPNGSFGWVSSKYVKQELK
ncbi:SH3 domain-containing protein [Gottfriedia acidiceleris]|uniref:SH3 domain-containing protein n=2 Tax=Gottfriedia acidiceleris TaxID=371036 RepID=UPI00142F5736|nr:SH3 domain-containing protein [Gottfriedia acidiceleris]